jgi:hypothetical protein
VIFEFTCRKGGRSEQELSSTMLCTGDEGMMLAILERGLEEVVTYYQNGCVGKAIV